MVANLFGAAISLASVAAACGQTCTPQWINGGIPFPNGTVFATAI